MKKLTTVPLRHLKQGMKFIAGGKIYKVTSVPTRWSSDYLLAENVANGEEHRFRGLNRTVEIAEGNSA